MRKRIRLTEAAVRTCFDNQTHQGDVLIAIYRLVFPDWDAIDRMRGRSIHPEASPRPA